MANPVFENNNQIFETLERIHDLTNRTNEILVNEDVLISADSKYDNIGVYQYSNYKVYAQGYMVYKASNDKFDVFYAFKYSSGKWEQDIKDYRDMLEHNLKVEVSKHKIKKTNI